MLTFFALQATKIHNYDTPWFMYALVIIALVGYALIEAKHTRNDHVIKLREAVLWTIFYVSIALLFVIPVYIFIGSQAAGEYLAAWAIEKALSLDNLFVMGIIFSSFHVQQQLQRRMLNYGIAGAIIFRLIFILTGIALLKRFEWISIVFGLILMKASWNAYRQASGAHSIENGLNITEKPLWKLINKVLPIYPKFVGHKLITKRNGTYKLTIMAAIIILIEFTDIIFAVDSVPAVLAVSPDRFIAYSSNVFAILGLRALFFVYQAVADKFWALSWALSAILAWISFKLIVTPLGVHIPIALSLSILGVLFTAGIVVSLVVKKHVKPTRVQIT